MLSRSSVVTNWMTEAPGDRAARTRDENPASRLPSARGAVPECAKGIFCCGSWRWMQ